MVGLIRSGKKWVTKTFSPLRPIYDVWMKLIAGFSWLLVRVLLTVAFISIFLLYGIVLRLLGKDPLSRNLSQENDSYWGATIINNSDRSDFERQY